jgi:hypothetical protein
LEATSGFEPLHRGFADPRLTTWLRRLTGGPSATNAGFQPRELYRNKGRLVKKSRLALTRTRAFCILILCGQVPERLMGRGCKPRGESLRRFESFPAHQLLECSAAVATTPVTCDDYTRGELNLSSRIWRPLPSLHQYTWSPFRDARCDASSRTEAAPSALLQCSQVGVPTRCHRHLH